MLQILQENSARFFYQPTPRFFAKIALCELWLHTFSRESRRLKSGKVSSFA